MKKNPTQTAQIRRVKTDRFPTTWKIIRAVLLQFKPPGISPRGPALSISSPFR